MSPLDASKITSKEELSAFVTLLLKDHDQHGRSWENPDLPRYLEALQAWLEDSDGYYINRKEDPGVVSPWRRLADGLAAARTYE